MEQQITQPTQQAPNGSVPGGYQQIIINQQESKKNGIGTAGFVFALLAFLFCWVPVLDIILWILGAIFSLVGIFRAPRGLAIAGTVISFIGIIVLITFFGALIGFASM